MSTSQWTMSSPYQGNGPFKFPRPHRVSTSSDNDHAIDDSLSPQTPNHPTFSPRQNGFPRDEKWQSRRAYPNGFPGGPSQGSTRRIRQKSLSEALRTINTRRGSVSENAHEIAEALKAPVSYTLIVRFYSINALNFY